MHSQRPQRSQISASPLWMMTQAPVLNELVRQLQQLRYDLMTDPSSPQTLRFSRRRLEEARLTFGDMILQGEERLHRLCELLCHTLLTSYQLRSIVIGEVTATRERFTITRPITSADLYSSIDLDLGSRQIKKLKFRVGDDGWSDANLIANMVDYQPTEVNRYDIHRIISRIKAEEEIWNKVVDEIFDLDSIVTRDKELKHMSRYVKDIFGIKIVVGEVDQVYHVQDTLEAMGWADPVLVDFKVEPGENTRALEFIERKNYLAGGNRKASGWRAYKSVVRWWDRTFEIQIQPLRNFLRERELLTLESHMSFKANRDRVRSQVAQQIPLFGYCQELLRWLFLYPDGFPPVRENIKIVIVD